jgi:predicted AAA+ superfamily ATPase
MLNDLIDHMDKPEVSIITGARQVGKTHLMDELKSYLKTKKKKALSFNLDIEADAAYFSSQNDLIRKIQLEIGTEKGFVFIDEIQRKTDAGLFLKGIYDMKLPYKFVVSGSGSIELKEKIQESLAGRKRIFELLPVTFDEFVNYKTAYKYDGRLPDYFDIEKTATKHHLLEYLNFGGYPRLVTEKSIKERFRLMDEIYQSYIDKDIIILLKVERPEQFRTLIRILAAMQGRILNIAELSKQTGLSVATVEKYLWYAEKTFVVREVKPYFKNNLKEITKASTVYFNDLGLRNHSINLMNTLNLPEQMGFVFQNFVGNILYQKYLYTASIIQYWRTTDKAEVDFIINSGDKITPVEVKYGTMKKPEISRSLRSFIDKYNPEEAWIVTDVYSFEGKLNDTALKFIPFTKLLFD